MRSLRWVGLVFSLLIVGVVGGLMAPLPSEAGLQQVTIRFDTTSEVPGTAGFYDITAEMISIPVGTTVNGVNICPTGTICFQFPPPPRTFTTPALPSGCTTGCTRPSRTYEIANYNNSASSPALLKIVDSNGGGSGNPDTISVTTLELRPVGYPNTSFDRSETPLATCNENTGAGSGCTTIYGVSPYYGEVHTVILKVVYRYDVANTATTCTNLAQGICSNFWKFVLGISGQFKAPTGVNVPPGQTTKGDMVRADAQALLGNGSALPTRLVTPAPPVTDELVAYRNGLAPPPFNIAIGPTVASYCIGCIPVACDSANSRFVAAGYPNITGTGRPDVDWCPLKKTVLGNDTLTDFGVENRSANPPSPQLTQGYYTSYPFYVCNTGGTCTPTVTATVEFGLNGPDKAVLTSSLDGALGTAEQSNKNFDRNVQKFLDDQAFANGQSNKNDGTKNTVQCVGDECPCLDRLVCTGTIALELQVNPAVDGLGPFPFTGSGEGINFPVTLADLPTGTIAGFASKTFPNLFIGGAPWSFTADLANWPAIPGYTGGWKVDTIDCSSQLNDPSAIPPIIVSDWEVDRADPKLTAKVTKLGRGDIVTCHLHGHKNKRG